MIHLTKIYLFILSAVFGCALSASGGENIRVAIADNLKSVTIKSSAGLTMEGPAAARRERKIIFTSATIGNSPVRITTPGEFLQVNGKSYRGSLEIRKKPNGLLLIINQLDIEDYLKGVVASEIPHDWEREVLNAQAVASRTYALYRKRTAGSRPYDIASNVDSQVYEGKSGERDAAIRAVRETEGIVITYEGEIIPAFYHSSCGGRTESAFELWNLDVPYLQGVDCGCQAISRYGVWEKRFPARQIESALGRRGYSLKGVHSASIDGVTAAGRVKRVALGHSKGALLIPAEKFRAALGYSLIPSVFFEIDMTGSDIVISGRGMGHGVGLCQWGAKEMAQRGQDYASILRYYYPGTSLVKETP
jgi:stage II sporulation protein D